MASQQPRNTDDDPLSFLKESAPSAVSAKTSLRQPDNFLAYGALALIFFGQFLPLVGGFVAFPAAFLLLVQHTSRGKLSTGGVIAAVVAWLLIAYQLVLLLVLLVHLVAR